MKHQLVQGFTSIIWQIRFNYECIRLYTYKKKLYPEEGKEIDYDIKLLFESIEEYRKELAFLIKRKKQQHYSFRKDKDLSQREVDTFFIQDKNTWEDDMYDNDSYIHPSDYDFYLSYMKAEKYNY